MELYGRQGDLVFKKVPAIREDRLKKATGLVLAGTGSSPHTVAGTVLFRAEGHKHFLKVTEATRAEHAGRHNALALEPGSYEVYPLRERGDGQDRAVED